jgi:hypothetical protein
MRTVGGNVEECRCDSCDAKIFEFSFAGENDLETDSLVSACRCNEALVVVTEATNDEWADLSANYVEKLEQRLEKEFGLTGLRVPECPRAEENKQAVSGVTFQDFLRDYKPAVLLYRCPCCSTGTTRSTARFSPREFEARGGKILLSKGLKLE